MVSCKLKKYVRTVRLKGNSPCLVTSKMAAANRLAIVTGKYVYEND